MTIHQQTQSELTDYPSLTDSQMSSVSASQQLITKNSSNSNKMTMMPVPLAMAGGEGEGGGGRISHSNLLLEDSATQTQVEDGGSFLSESVSRIGDLNCHHQVGPLYTVQSDSRNHNQLRIGFAFDLECVITAAARRDSEWIGSKKENPPIAIASSRTAANDCNSSRQAHNRFHHRVTQPLIFFSLWQQQ